MTAQIEIPFDLRDQYLVKLDKTVEEKGEWHAANSVGVLFASPPVSHA